MAALPAETGRKSSRCFFAYNRKDLPRTPYRRGNFRPKEFTGKELDNETGLYYFGARYLDAKTSRWLSGDPALGDYLPVAPNGDDAKKHNQNLPGMGGAFNVVNLHVYHYAGNNPVKYIDPDGRADIITADTTREQYNDMTKWEPEYSNEQKWNEMQNYFAENPNGGFYRAASEIHWQQFEDKNDIKPITERDKNRIVGGLMVLGGAGVMYGGYKVGSLLPNRVHLGQRFLRLG